MIASTHVDARPGHAGSTSTRSDLLARWGMVAVVGVHLALGAAFIDRLSLWGDEGFTAETVRLPLGEMWRMLTDIDVNMSAYYTVLSAWTWLVGDSDVALRAPSLLMTAATTLIGARLVARWFGPVPGLAAAVGLGLSSYLLRVGLTARPFAMLGLLLVVSTWCLVRALGRDDLGPWLLLALVDVVALYTSLLAVLFIGAQVLHVVVVDRRFRRAQLVAAAVLAVGCVPTLAFLAPPDTLGWLTGTNVRVAVESVLGRRSGTVLALLVVAGVLLRPRPVGGALADQPRSRLLLPGLVVVPAAAMLALLPVQTLFLPAYLVAVFVAAAMVAGAVTAPLRRVLAWGVVGLLAASSAVGLVTHLEPQPGLEVQDWRTATSTLDELVEPGDTVVFPNTFYRIVAEHYGRSGRFVEVARPAMPSVPFLSQVPYEYDLLKRTEHYMDADRVLDELSGQRRVWRVGPEDPIFAFVSSTLEGAGWRSVEVHDVDGVAVRVLERGS